MTDKPPHSLAKTREYTRPDPPWIRLLHAIHLECRDEEISKGRDPDPEIEQWLRENGRWPEERKFN